jgi:hypothetical protein
MKTQQMIVVFRMAFQEALETATRLRGEKPAFKFPYVCPEPALLSHPFPQGNSKQIATFAGEVVEPGHAIHVGMSAPNDVLGALDAGWSAVYSGEATMEIEGVVSVPRDRIATLGDALSAAGMLEEL